MKIKKFKEFEQVENNMDRTKIKSNLFFVSNVFKYDRGFYGQLGDVKYVEVKPIKHDSIYKIFIYSNSVVFYGYKNSEPIAEINNINMDTNEELVDSIDKFLLKKDNK